MVVLMKDKEKSFSFFEGAFIGFLFGTLLGVIIMEGLKQLPCPGLK